MKAKEFDIKKRDPNWRAMQDIRRSGAGGQHKDKKKAAKQGDVKHKGKDVEEGVAEGSDWGEPREILEDVLQTLEREVEWPLTEVMDPKEVRQLLAPIVRAVNDKMMSMEEGWDDQDDWGSMSHREFKRREMEHELGHENKPRENKGMWFYNVPTGKDLEARSIGLKQTKSGKWYSRKPSTVADMKFGQGKYWEPK